LNTGVLLLNKGGVPMFLIFLIFKEKLKYLNHLSWTN
jgi:hypothetical protein